MTVYFFKQNIEYIIYIDLEIHILFRNLIPFMQAKYCVELLQFFIYK